VVHSKLRLGVMISSRVPSPGFMGRLIKIALAALLVSLVATPHASAQQELTFSLFERYIDALRVQANIPGLSAAIVQDERITWEKGFGFSDVEHSIAARPDTPYYISGLTEALSSALLLEQCVETAHAALDDQVQQRVPAYSESYTTMRDLLSHKSPTGGFKYDASRYAAGLTPLAEVCVGKGTPFRQALWQRIFERLGMFDSVPAQNVDDASADDRVQFDSTDLDRFSGVLKRLALPYRVSGGNATMNTSIGKSVDAATGAVSTVRDLAKFDSGIDGAVLLHRESMATMWSNQSGMPTGLGWFVQNYNGEKVVWQFGYTPGAYSSLILKVPERHLTLILLANSDGLSAPFPLQDGDVNSSLFARTFLRLFIG
jgi:CubicO group peptidase (beta-lactamase class C family)